MIAAYTGTACTLHPKKMRPSPRCLIPRFDGAILSLEWKEAVWDRFDRMRSLATTTHAVRAAIQRSKASLATLSRESGINPKTAAKWRKRTMVVAFRRHTLLPLDDCLYALRPSIPHLTRSALHRCLQRHGISRLPDVEGDKPRR
jgi:hypothetical protein